MLGVGKREKTQQPRAPLTSCLLSAKWTNPTLKKSLYEVPEENLKWEPREK